MGARVGRKVQRRGRNRPLASRSQEKRTGPLRAARKTPTTLRATACSGASTAINKKEEIFFLFLSYSSIAVFHFHSRPQSLWLSQSYTSTSASCFFWGFLIFFSPFLVLLGVLESPPSPPTTTDAFFSLFASVPAGQSISGNGGKQCLGIKIKRNG